VTASRSPCPRHGATSRVSVRRFSRRAATVLVAALATFLVATPAGADPASQKQAEAEQVLAQIEALDMEVGAAVEEYNGARVRLEQIQERQAANERALEIAKKSFGNAQDVLASRIHTLYTSGDASTLEILLGATSIDDFLARVDATSRVSEQDARIVSEIRAVRAEVKKREAELEQAHAEQEEVVADLERRKAEIEARLAERQAMLATIKEEIARIQEEERRRQARLQAEAEERLADQQASAPTPVSSGGGGGGNPPPSKYGGVVGVAMQFLGVPYVWGGASPSGFDCSGLVMYAFAQVGVSLPHNAAMQYAYGTPVSRSALAPGDVVFFNGLGHNGIYIGGGQFIHAPHTGDVVKISSMGDSWYASTYVGARRM
jgi:cell wall-associated NlpC family hydrolase